MTDVGHLVGAIGALFDQVLQHAHALIKGLLHVRDSVLQVLNLGLQLHHVFVDAPGRGDAEEGSVANKASTSEYRRIFIVISYEKMNRNCDVPARGQDTSPETLDAGASMPVAKAIRCRNGIDAAATRVYFP